MFLLLSATSPLHPWNKRMQRGGRVPLRQCVAMCGKVSLASAARTGVLVRPTPCLQVSARYGDISKRSIDTTLFCIYTSFYTKHNTPSFSYKMPWLLLRLQFILYVLIGSSVLEQSRFQNSHCRQVKVPNAGHAYSILVNYNVEDIVFTIEIEQEPPVSSERTGKNSEWKFKYMKETAAPSTKMTIQEWHQL